MKLISDDFKNKEMMDAKFAYRKDNVSPHLKWEDAPSDAKSFAISCNDPDAPVGNWIHWLVINIPPDVKEIPQGGPVPGTELDNDYGNQGYGGPAPPSGTHRYVFKVHAMKKAKYEAVNKGSFFGLMDKEAIDTAQLIGLYKK